MPATLQNIYRYPVKSMGGQPLNAATLAAKGIPGDRAWAIKDDERRSIHNGKRFPQLMDCTAELLEIGRAHV